MIADERRRRRATAGAAAALTVLIAGGPVRAADPEPVPSGLEEFGSASMDDVSRALAKVRRRYGDDAIVIQTQLLVNAMRNGSLRATGVRVDGIREHHAKKYLVFVVETGFVFDSATRDETTRVQVLWSTIMAPTLEHLTALRIPADGIKVEMQYHHRPYRSLTELRADIDRPGTAEQTDFYVLVPDVDAVVRRTVTPQTLIARATIMVDGVERAAAVAPPDLPTTAGPD
jgi:hypothetical protein